MIHYFSMRKFYLYFLYHFDTKFVDFFLTVSFCPKMKCWQSPFAFLNNQNPQISAD